MGRIQAKWEAYFIFLNIYVFKLFIQIQISIFTASNMCYNYVFFLLKQLIFEAFPSNCYVIVSYQIRLSKPTLTSLCHLLFLQIRLTRVYTPTVTTCYNNFAYTKHFQYNLYIYIFIHLPFTWSPDIQPYCLTRQMCLHSKRAGNQTHSYH